MHSDQRVKLLPDVVDTAWFYTSVGNLGLERGWEGNTGKNSTKVEYIILQFTIHVTRSR